MAYKSLARPTSALKYCYNLTMAVGQNKPNNPDDVMLVQLCLQQIFRDPTLCPAAPKDYTVVPDGKCGPITRNAIWIFQSYLQRVGGMVYPDGVIDRASDLRVTARDTDHIYTILWLNRYLEFAIGKERFDNLENERNHAPPTCSEACGERHLTLKSPAADLTNMVKHILYSVFPFPFVYQP